MAPLRIAIIGAGPAGLTLARLLQRRQVACAVFELDPSLAHRDQGGIVDLHRDDGQLALREAGLLDEFRRAALPEGECVKLMRASGEVLFDENRGSVRSAETADRPEINRLVLRRMLMESLEPGTVRWGRKLVAVEASATGEGKYDLRFAEGAGAGADEEEETGFDAVVGADGAWSRVRRLLTDVQPHYAGGTLVEMWALDVDARKPWLARFVGAGSMFMFDDGRWLAAQRSETAVRTYAVVQTPEADWAQTCGVDWTDGEGARRALVEGWFADCAEDLKRAIRESDDRLVVRPLHMLPVGIRWDAKPGVTVIGDAAHLMTPAGGVGVNLALVDALHLARAIVDASDDSRKLHENMAGFEADMFARAERYAAMSARKLESHFTARGIEERAERMRGAMEAARAAKQ